MIGKTSGVIVLMVEPGVGMIVCKNDSSHTVGWYSDHWYMDTFKDYTGSVTITNEED
jgi:hypothetical protein